jgi:hypothetical protein
MRSHLEDWHPRTTMKFEPSTTGSSELLASEIFHTMDTITNKMSSKTYGYNSGGIWCQGGVSVPLMAGHSHRVL